MLQNAVDFLRSRIATRPQVAVILGSGLGSLADKIERAVSIRFCEVPGFSDSTAGGHRGELIVGTLGEKTVVAMAGRLHRYEGHSNDEVAFPVRVMSELGANVLIASNAAGGVNPKLQVGDIVIIRDCIDWMRGCSRWLAMDREGRGHEGLGHLGLEVARRGDDCFDRELAMVAMACAREHDFVAYEGTYLATLGPCYETRAEYRMMRRIGTDVVGMSTVPEVLAARKLGMRVIALSMVSNVARPDEFVGANHEEVLQAGLAAADKMESIVRAVVAAV